MAPVDSANQLYVTLLLWVIWVGVNGVNPSSQIHSYGGATENV